MLALAMLFWVGLELSAPTWYWWCWGICIGVKVIKLCWDMYKAGAGQ